MKATKDEKTGLWYVQYRYTDWQGNRKKSTKRGFKTKRDAEAWLSSFLSQKQSDITMTFKDFVQLYNEDMSTRLREHTIRNKAYIVNSKILPYFGELKLNEITATQIRRWQNELLKQNYSKTYLRTINNQLRTLFNYASTYYDLPNNPCKKAGNIGKNNADEMNFWTTQEFKQFADCIMDKQESYTLFTTLFWTGMRIGELLALTISDIDFDRKTISITKSYQRIGNRDIVTEPKTPKSVRTIHIPDFLAELLQEYVDAVYGAKDGGRLGGIAERTGCAIVLIGHMNKGSGVKAAYRGIGSIDFYAVARSVLLIGKMPKDDTKRVVCQIKSNLALKGESLSFSLTEDGFKWTGFCDVTEDELLTGIKADTKSNKACVFVTDILEEHGKYPAKEIFEKGIALGISKRTIENAKQELGVKSFKDGNQWFWKL